MPLNKPSRPITNKLVVMSFHPVTRKFADQIERICGPADAYYDAANLRKLPVTAGIRQLRDIRTERLVIALEGDGSKALIGPLSIAASFTRAGTITMIGPDLHVVPIGRLGAFWTIGQVAYDSLASRRSLARLMRAGAQMAKSPMPRPVTPGTGSRILYLDANISLGTSVGGSIGHTAGVIGGFLDHGFQVDYASLKPMPTEQPGAQWIRLQADTLLAVPSELNFYRYAEAIESKIIPQHRPRPWTFIYQRFSVHNFTGSLLGRRLNIPVVLEFNGSEAWASANWGTRLALYDTAVAAEKLAVDSADLIVTVSDELGYELKRRGIPDSRIVVYPNCVDPEVFNPRRFAADELTALRERHGIPKDALVVCFIGTFGQWHGVEFLAECIRDLVRDDIDWVRKRKIHFLLVGDGLKMPMVRQFVGQPPTSGYVTLTGLVAQSEAARYLACADLLVSPHVPNADGSNFFGSPTKLFEYMAMEKPIVASALGQIEDVIAGRGATKLGAMPPGAGDMCGFLFEPGNAQEFKRVLRQVVDDMPAAAKRATAARAEILNRYTWKRHVDAVLARMSENGLLSRSSNTLVA